MRVCVAAMYSFSATSSVTSTVIEKNNELNRA
jgi:hypothetical protein